MLVAASKGKPSQVNLRRATSSAYYALFHCLARSAADLLIGGDGATRSERAWEQVYRAIEHGFAKNACKDGRLIGRFPDGIQDFANAFVTMQDKRHEADYNPTGNFAKSEVVQDIATVVQALSGFKAVPIKDRRAFCALVLFKKRPIV